MRNAAHANQMALDFAVYLPRRVETPIARRKDPISSHLAAKEITENGARTQQQAQTTAAVRAYPGRTSQELADLTKLDRYMLGRRLSECVTAGTVRRGEMKLCSITKKQATAWLPT